MKVKDLKKLIEQADDESEVVIPMSKHFDGVFYSPDMEESGEQYFGEEDEPDEPMFLLAPTGFSDEPNNLHELN